MKKVNATSETLNFLLSHRNNDSCWRVLRVFLADIRQYTNYLSGQSPSQSIASSVLDSRYLIISNRQIGALLAAAQRREIPFIFDDDAEAFLEHEQLPAITVNTSFDYEVDGTSIKSAMLVPSTDPNLGLQRLPAGSPIANLFAGKRAGDSFTLNGKHYSIANVYARV